MITGFLFLSLFVFIAIGVPIAVSLGLASILCIALFDHNSFASLSLKLFATMFNYTLLAIPFFVLSATFMTTGGVARRLVAFTLACLGHIRGGIPVAGVMACMLFAAVSGSSPATVVAIGTIMIAAMVRAGYTREFAAGIICNAGTLGILIPPSIPMIVYAAATETSVGRLFAAGVLPGILLCLMLMGGLYINARRQNIPKTPRASAAEIWKTFREAFWGLLLIVLVLGGIYGGIFTPTEAAAVAAVYAFAVGVFVYRDMRMVDVPTVLVEAGKVTIMLMFILANAFLFSLVLTEQRIPHLITAALVGAQMQSWLFLVVVNIILLIAGNFMEPAVILLILAPLILPIAVKLGIDPIHLGIMMTVNMEIGMVTPPVGLNLYATSAVTGMDMISVVRSALPWLVILLAFLVIVTYVPVLSTALPDFFFGPETVLRSP
jgi:C4-dicarboxylate transporter, DctM subunit